METNWVAYRNSVLRYLKMMLLMPEVVCYVVEGDPGDDIKDEGSIGERGADGEVLGEYDGEPLRKYSNI
ncbi:hypothetical protein M7I_3523 [Glarea lozoyensis 74030]|uniref:Uncharacterized protein n=1 Tax=Glarea lozoyensis (strain ATCC 74030 / MF5533) TaxID=1104152 RepID=H0ELQ4_GLAL7|nr:hypothetical protein M7I_3523 [Glarea lozoyensis 74030]